MSQIKSNIFYSVLSQGMHFVNSVLFALLLPKFLGIEEYGFWQLFIFYTQYGGLLHLGLTDGMYLKEGGKYYERLEFKKLGAQFRILMLWICIVIIPFLILGLKQDDPNRTFVILASCIFVIIFNFNAYINFLFQAVSRIKESAVSNLIYISLFTLSTSALLFTPLCGYKSVVVAYIVCYSIGTMFLSFRALSLLSNFFSGIHKDCINEVIYNIKNGFLLLVSNLTGMLIVGVGRFMVDGAWGIKAFGIISFSLVIVNFFMAFINQIGYVLFPELRRWDKDKTKLFYSNFRKTFSLILPLFLLLYLPFEYLVKLWLPKYAESVEFMIFLMPLCIFDAKMNLLCNTIFKVYNKIKTLLFTNIIALLVSLLLLFPAVYLLGDLKYVALSMLLAIIARSMIAEIKIDRIFCNEFDTSSLLSEIFLVIAFVFLNLYLDHVMATTIYFLLCCVYLICNRTIIKQLFRKYLK